MGSDMAHNVGYPTAPRQAGKWETPLAQSRCVVETHMTSIGPALKALRVDRKITQAEAAAAADIDRSHLSKIESAKDPPSVRVLALLAAFYRVPLRDVLPPTDPLARAEVVTHADEIAWLRLYRSLPVDQARALLAALSAKQAA